MVEQVELDDVRRLCPGEAGADGGPVGAREGFYHLPAEQARCWRVLDI